MPRFAIFERSFRWYGVPHANPWESVRLDVRLLAPSGRVLRTGGFFYGDGVWKFRYSPSEIGRWRWQATLADRRRRQAYEGAFRVFRSPRPGYVRRNPHNGFRWVLDNGAPYYPLGINSCALTPHGEPARPESWGLDGDFRGAGGGRAVDTDTYLSTYAAAGVNLFRWGVDNCSFGLYRRLAPAGNVYLERESRWADELFRSLRRHGYRIYMTLFGSAPFPRDASDPEQLAAVRRYVSYVVHRYGAYVDFWELMNEQVAPRRWYLEVGRHLRRADPYRHPVSTSFERPDLPVVDVSAPHWYELESEFESDLVTWNRIHRWKAAGKPVIVGEQGNAWHNWDERSALRMRLRAWTAFFAEGALVFWNSSYVKDYRRSHANIYLGPEERAYIRALQSFTAGFDSRATVVPATVSRPDLVRAYVLRGPRDAAAYLHAYTDHERPTVGVRLTLDVARPGKAVWISPSTGAVLASAEVGAGRQALDVPPFVTDVALKVAGR